MDKQLANVDQLRHVKRTDGSKSHNYTTWKWRLETVLELNGYLGLVTGEEGPEDNPRESTYEKRQKTAYAAIAFTVSDDFAKLINKTKDPQVAWQSLKSHFHQKSLSNEIALDRQLCMFRMNEADSMLSHIDRLKDLADSLDAIGQGLSESRKVITLLRSLPDSYTVVSTALECQSAATLKFDFVCERLLDEEAKRKVKQEDAEVSQALSASRTSNSSQKYQPRCYCCKQLGHKQRDCPDKRENKGKQVNNHNTAAMTVEEERDYGFVSVLVADKKCSELKNLTIIDSGGTENMTNNKELLDDYKPLVSLEGKKVYLGDGRVITAQGKGHMKLTLDEDDNQDTMYVPDLFTSLFSVRSTTLAGHKVLFDGDECRVYSKGAVVHVDGRLIAHGHRDRGGPGGKLYVLDRTPATATIATSTEVTAELWHQRYGHLCMQQLQILAKGRVDGLSELDSVDFKFCKACAEGKLHRFPFPTGGGKRAREVLGIVHSDVVGPMATKTPSGSKYVVTFVDDLSRFVTVYFLKEKSAVLDAFKKYSAEVSKRFGRNIKILRSYNGGEYTSQNFTAFLKSSGIQHEEIVPTEQNGLVERMNRILFEMAHTMLRHAHLPDTFWAEAMQTTVYLMNRSPMEAVERMTPFEAWNEVKPDVTHLRVFGSICFARVPKEKRKDIMCKLMGYGETKNGYRVYDLQTRQFFYSSDVVFEEGRFKVEQSSVKSAPTCPTTNNADLGHTQVEEVADEGEHMSMLCDSGRESNAIEESLSSDHAVNLKASADCDPCVSIKSVGEFLPSNAVYVDDLTLQAQFEEKIQEMKSVQMSPNIDSSPIPFGPDDDNGFPSVWRQPQFRCQSLFGSPLYSALGTRPNISVAVGVLSQFNVAKCELYNSALTKEVPKQQIQYLRNAMLWIFGSWLEWEY